MARNQVDGDKFFKEFGYAPSVQVYESAFAQAKVSVCHVQVPPIPPDFVEVQGTAGLYQLTNTVFSAITNNHVLPVTDKEFLSRTVFTFAGLGPIRFSENEIKCCTTSEKLDATIIELTEECVKRLLNGGAKFIRLASARDGNKIAMAQYPEGVLSFDKGVIHEIRDNELYYYLGGAPGSSGSPILLWDFHAIGIHKESANRADHSALGPVRRGTCLSAIAGFHSTASK